MLSHRQLFLRHNAQTSQAPLGLEVVRGEGSYLYDAAGRKYFDAISGISVSATGHCHPSVVEAVQKQAGLLMHSMVYGEHVLVPQVELAARLDALVGREMAGAEPLSVYLVNSGAEAVEAAIKLSRRATGRKKILAFQNAYHGSTTGALALMSTPYFKTPFEPLLPEVDFAPFNHDEIFNLIDPSVAAVFLELVQSESGYIPADLIWAKKVEQKCKEMGTLLVVDEIQTGIGRTGTLFAFQQFNLIPDILLSAKGLGGGMPIGALMAKKSWMDLFSIDPYLGHITTFGGHPVSAAASLACLHVLIEEDLISMVSQKSALIKSTLIEGGVADVQGLGLMLSVPTGSYEKSWNAMQMLLSRGYLTDWFLHEPGRLRIAPPLIAKEDELKLMAQEFAEVITTIS